MLAGWLGGLMIAVALPAAASAASTVVVTPANTQGWSTAETTPGGAVSFVSDPTSPAPPGALQLTTDATTTAKAQYMHAANTPLSAVTELSYYTKQVSGPPIADPSYQLPTFANGTTGFTTLVFEPYQNPGNNGNPSIIPNAWQKWDVAGGLFYSTRTVTCSNGTLVKSRGAPLYTLAQLKATCPNAVVLGFGVNIGTNNPSYTVRTDLFDFNGTTYNFEQTNPPTDPEQCRNGGYVNYTDAQGSAFPSERDCVRFVENANSNNDGQRGPNDQQGGSGA